MPVFDIKFVLPDVVYHGTTFAALNGIAGQPINPGFWNDNKDFGAAFYTTIDLFQATDWARKNIKAILRQYKLMTKKDHAPPLRIPRDRLPLVIALSCNPDAYRGDNIDVLDFRGESRAWSQLILSHRYFSEVGNCSCQRHPQIACGPMADNDTGGIINLFKADNRSVADESDRRWFHNEIITSKKGSRLKGLELGDQIAFADENLNSMLKFKGYYLFNPDKLQLNLTRENYREEWDYYDSAGKPSKDD